MRGLFLRLAAIVCLTAGLSACASTETDLTVGSIPSAPRSILAPATSGMFTSTVHAIPPSGIVADVPPGYVSFCLRFADQCADPGKDAQQAIVLTPATWDMLTKVNLATNENMWPEDDQRHYGRAEFWTIPTDGYGDCEDSALTKRKALMAAGMPEAALRIAVVITPNNARHAVLNVVTDRGDYVLDNLRDQIIPWDRTGYTWIERQDPSKATGWASLLPADRMLAATDSALPTGSTSPKSGQTQPVSGAQH
jgi:predicted transglutaminase-like cysteine proteinase